MAHAVIWYGVPRISDGAAERSRSENCVRVTRTESVPEGCRVRHFDELDERAQDAVVGLDAESTVCDAPGLSTADVIVYTAYYRIE